MRTTSGNSQAVIQVNPKIEQPPSSPSARPFEKTILDISNKPKSPAEIAQDFAHKTKHLKAAEGQQLRLKGDHIKLAKYSGLNPFKLALQAIGARGRVYDRQMHDLRKAYDLPQHISLEAKVIATYLDKMVQLPILRRNLDLLQTQAREHAPSLPALKALINEVGERKEALNKTLNELRENLTAHDGSDHDDDLLAIDQIRAEVSQTNGRYNLLDALGKQIESKQLEIQRLIETLPPSSNYPVAPDAFFAILLTSPGRSAINESLVGKSDVRIDAGEICESLELLHQYAGKDFHLSAGQRTELEDAAAALSRYEAVSGQFDSFYLDALKPHEDTPNLEPFREITYMPSNEAGDWEKETELRSMMTENEQLEFSTPLQTFAKLFDSHLPDANIIYEVHGCSMKKVVSGLLPATAEYMSRRVFSPWASFTVEDVQRRDDGRLLVRLVERLMPLTPSRESLDGEPVVG